MTHDQLAALGRDLEEAACGLGRLISATPITAVSTELREDRTLLVTVSHESGAEFRYSYPPDGAGMVAL